ncbi:MAG: hypothetical protein JWR26_2874 [Pedosphaera sp.]|nr:hypothetical protein [Pedosphaera sp.]
MGKDWAVEGSWADILFYVALPRRRSLKVPRTGRALCRGVGVSAKRGQATTIFNYFLCRFRVFA